MSPGHTTTSGEVSQESSDEELCRESAVAARVLAAGTRVWLLNGDDCGTSVAGDAIRMLAWASAAAALLLEWAVRRLERITPSPKGTFRYVSCRRVRGCWCSRKVGQ
jgi:hypothetical protein